MHFGSSVNICCDTYDRCNLARFFRAYEWGILFVWYLLHVELGCWMCGLGGEEITSPDVDARFHQVQAQDQKKKKTYTFYTPLQSLIHIIVHWQLHPTWFPIHLAFKIYRINARRRIDHEFVLESILIITSISRTHVHSHLLQTPRTS